MKIAKQKTLLAAHIQLKNGKFADLLKPFVPHQIGSLETSEVKTMATVVKWANRKITLDGSGIVANAIFLQLELEFGGGESFDDMTEQIRADEGMMFKILGIEEDLA